MGQVFAVSLLPVLLGVLVAWGGVLGLRRKPTRGRGAGVRTEATLRSDEAFRVANRVAGVPTLVGGLIGILGGVAALFMPSTGGLVIAAVVALLGMFALTAGGGVLGHRAAAAIPAPEPEGEPCSPCAGCDGAACLSQALPQEHEPASQ